MRAVQAMPFRVAAPWVFRCRLANPACVPGCGALSCQVCIPLVGFVGLLAQVFQGFQAVSQKAVSETDVTAPESVDSDDAYETVYEIDAFEFVRRAKSDGGSVALKEFWRLCDGLPEQEGQAHWQVQGAKGPLGEQLLHLKVQSTVVVACQRCLQGMPWEVDTEAVLQLVESESELDDEDESAEGGEHGDAGGDYDRVLGSQYFNVYEQIEDELILSLPYVPMHNVCSGGVAAQAEQDAGARRVSPFAALAQLKKN